VRNWVFVHIHNSRLTFSLEGEGAELDNGKTSFIGETRVIDGQTKTVFRQVPVIASWGCKR
jgi:hypothetical protein